MYVKEIGVTPMLPEEALCEQTMQRDGGCERLSWVWSTGTSVLCFGERKPPSVLSASGPKVGMTGLREPGALNFSRPSCLDMDRMMDVLKTVSTYLTKQKHPRGIS